MTEPVEPEAPEPPKEHKLHRSDLLPLAAHYQTALGCSVLVVLALAAFYLWRC